MRWSRITVAFPWWTTALLAGFITLQSFFWWDWLTGELPGLERYYLPAYFCATQDAKHPGAQTRWDPPFKTAPGRKRDLVVASDVVSGKGSALAVRDRKGWRGSRKVHL